jgi:hypothetical protein
MLSSVLSECEDKNLLSADELKIFSLQRSWKSWKLNFEILLLSNYP